MEIREGIKYQPKGSFEIFEVVKDPNSTKRFCGKFTNGSYNCSYNPGEWRKDFKSGQLKIIEYPYKIGDYVLNIHSIEHCSTGQVFKITHINSEGLSLIYNDTPINRKHEPSFFRPCFKDEILGKKKPEKIVKEDLSCLANLLNNLSIK